MKKILNFSSYKNNQPNASFLKIILFFAVLIEILSNTFWLYSFNNPRSPISHVPLAGISNIYFITWAYFISGILIGTIPLFVNSNPIIFQPGKFSTRFRVILLFLLVSCAILFIIISNELIKSFPLDWHLADMLPVIKVMCERLINHQVPYAKIHGMYNETPVYLPAMWLPFLPAVLFHFDLRWITVFSVLATFILFIFAVPFSQWRFSIIYPFILILLFLCYFLLIDNSFIALSEEGVVIAYYILLAYGINKNKFILQGIAISLCLLSRYSLFFWIPAYFVFVFYQSGRQQAYRLLTAFLCSTALLMLIGKMFPQIPLLMTFPKWYLNSALNPIYDWGHIAIIQSGLGLTKFFPYSDILLVNRICIWSSALLPFSLLALYRFAKNKINIPFFGICGLKLTLVFFYNFIIMPFTYLFYVSTFLSLFILFSYYFPGRERKNFTAETFR